jgi:hypothetical protein
MILRMQEFFPVAWVRPAIALAFVLALGASSAAVPYSYTNIADTSMGFEVFTDNGQTRPDVNNSGTVAFWARKPLSVYGIYTGSGGPLTPITTSNSSTVLEKQPSLNDAGTVAFSARPTLSTSALLTGNGGPLTTIEDDSSPRSLYLGAKINNGGDIAFTAMPDTTEFVGAYLNVGGVTSLIAEQGTSGASSAYNNFIAADLNNLGQLAILALAPTTSQAIYTGSGGAVSLVVESDALSFLSEPSINDAGSIVYRVKPILGPLFAGIYKYNAGVTTTVLPPIGTSGVSTDGDPQLNNRDEIAYWSYNNGHPGIILTDGTTFSNVISLGDPLFGSTVASIDSKFSLNDRGDVAFYYQLASGRRGVALAVAAPEPAGLALAGFGIACMLCRRRRAR